MNRVSDKSTAYFHDTAEFNTYFENSKLKNYKDILQKTVAVYDDRSMADVDVLFTINGVVPVIRGNIKATIHYASLASEKEMKRILTLSKSIIPKDTKSYIKYSEIAALIPGSHTILAGRSAAELYSIRKVVDVLKPMFDEICEVMTKWV